MAALAEAATSAASAEAATSAASAEAILEVLAVAASAASAVPALEVSAATSVAQWAHRRNGFCGPRRRTGSPLHRCQQQSPFVHGRPVLRTLLCRPARRCVGGAGVRRPICNRPGPEPRGAGDTHGELGSRGLRQSRHCQRRLPLALWVCPLPRPLLRFDLAVVVGRPRRRLDRTGVLALRLWRLLRLCVLAVRL